MTTILISYAVAAVLVAGLSWLLLRNREPEQVPYTNLGE